MFDEHEDDLVQQCVVYVIEKAVKDSKYAPVLLIGRVGGTLNTLACTLLDPEVNEHLRKS